MTSFDINHDGLLQLNDQLYRAVGELDSYVQDINMTLRNIPEAIESGATQLWQERQNTWNRAMQDIHARLNTDTLRSIDVHEIFKEGDYTGTKIFIQ